MGAPISGIDVSKHQGDMDYDGVAREGHRFVICKATEGQDFVDPKFFENWSALVEREDQLYRGAYHFARPDSTGGYYDGEAEANDFCDVLEAAGHYLDGALPPALDYEVYSGKGTAANLDFIEAFTETVERRLGRGCMIYTCSTVWGYQTGNSDRWSALPLWLVNYTAAGNDFDGTQDPPNLDKIAWDDWAIWQWSGGGDFAYGPETTGKTIDLNWFNGTEDDLARMCLIPEDDRDPTPCPPNRDAALRVLTSVQQDLVSALSKVEMLRAVLEQS